jgi:hypothetical protein
MINFQKILVAKLVDEVIISNHIYVPKELQHRLRQVREHLEQINITLSPPIPSKTLRQNAWNTTNAMFPSAKVRDANIPQSSTSCSN